MKPVVARLHNPVRDYAWGSREVIARLQGQAVPSPGPEAELWLGAHPSDPSTWLVDGAPCPLDAAIAAAPDHMVGGAVIDRFGPRLPFLLKVLAVARPLSLQAHPTATQAREGFEREEARGIEVDAPERNYTDPSPKPELIRALSPFDALCGFRPPDATLDLLDRLDVAAIGWLRDLLRSRGRAALPTAVARLLTLPQAERAPLVASIATACAAWDRMGRWAQEARWLLALATRYPTDPGVAVASLLELIQLEPGGSLHVPAGTLHSYLSGAGVEIMASSDNVLRGGLTDKHVDVAELLHVLEAEPGPPVRVTPLAAGDELVHPTPAPHFRLAELTPDGRAVELDGRGGQVLFALDGEASVTVDGVTIELSSGQSVFVAAAARAVVVAGEATVFRATVGEEGSVPIA